MILTGSAIVTPFVARAALTSIFTNPETVFVISIVEGCFHPHFGVGAARELLARTSRGSEIKTDRIVGVVSVASQMPSVHQMKAYQIPSYAGCIAK